MSKPIKRREFLKGAATLAAGSVLTLGPSSVLASVVGAAGPKQVPTLYFWDGIRFVPASSLALGDRTILSAEVSIRSFGSPGRLQSLDQVVTTPKGEAAFHAWTVPPIGMDRVRFVASTWKGITLRANLVDGSADMQLIRGAGIQPKLKEGVYVLAFGSLSGYAYREDEPGGPVVNGVGPYPGGYVVIEIDRA